MAAYSPDGNGIHGTIIAIISCNTDQNNFEQDKAKFEAFVKDIRILRTGRRIYNQDKQSFLSVTEGRLEEDDSLPKINQKDSGIFQSSLLLTQRAL